MSPRKAQDAGDRPVVIVVGGGFAGLTAVKALKHAPVRVLLIDRRNHHVFQPLLYQVATAMLPPETIAAPIRELVRKQQNTTVAMADVTGIDPERRHVVARVPDRGETTVAYDYLVLATGVGQSYFGRNFAILEAGKLRLSGFPGWAAWAAIHVLYLPQHRGETVRRWVRAYLRGKRGSRLILDAQ